MAITNATAGYYMNGLPMKLLFDRKTRVLQLRHRELSGKRQDAGVKLSILSRNAQRFNGKRGSHAWRRIAARLSSRPDRFNLTDPFDAVFQFRDENERFWRTAALVLNRARQR